MTPFRLPTLNQIREAHSWKRDYERYLPLSRYIYRPLGFILTWIAIRIGITTEAASWLSLIVGLAGLFCLTTNKLYQVWVGIVFLIFFNLLDCVDGSIARVTKTENPYGKYLDKVVGSVVDFAFFPAVGILTYKHPHLVHWQSPLHKIPLFYLIIAAVCTYFYILLLYVENLFELVRSTPRSIEYHNNDYQYPSAQIHPSSPIQPQKEPYWKYALRLIDRNFRVRETHYLFLIIALPFHVLDLYLTTFATYYLIHTIFSAAIFFSSAKKMRDINF
jgi:phosphatidylglycerophosphate synthase